MMNSNLQKGMVGHGEAADYVNGRFVVSEAEEHPDIFDRIMRLPGLRALEPLYRKYKEQLLYVFFGGMTFFVNLAVFAFVHQSMRWNELLANVAAWVVAVFFAYVTNKEWVFCSKGLGKSATLLEMGKFFAGRLFTLVVEEIILFAFITCMHFASMPVKVVGQVVVIILNYVISRLFVFHK